MSSPEQDVCLKGKGGQRALAGRTWSSGRRLTESQRARKRELDRIRSRQHRLAMVNRVADLEAKLRLAVAGESDDRSDKADLLVQQHELSNSPRNHTGLASAHSFGHNSEHQMYNNSTVESDSFVLSQCSVDILPAGRRWLGEHNTSSRDSLQNPQDESTLFTEHTSDHTGGLTSGVQPCIFQSSPQPVLGSPLIPALLTTSALHSTTQMLAHVQQGRKAEVCVDAKLNQHLLIRAVTQGWSEVETLCPIWKLLRFIDTLLFRGASPITRLVMLQTIHQMLLGGCTKVDQLPSWYRPRPTQRMFCHDEIADFFAWPGMRERLVLSSDFQLTDEFWECFSGHFRFLWPFPFEDIYGIDLSTGYFRFSALFEKRLQELTMWQMEKQFFALFPDFVDDISVAETCCLEAIENPLGTQSRMQDVDLRNGATEIGFGQAEDFAPDLVVSPEISGQSSCKLASFSGPSYTLLN
ncbi:hypothetical protein TrVGV298_002426 [Trichoderma virens]|nr:hypothetical protein TrVGV298_002426 [Trichoderma virens]